eukprot:Pgem_evm1s7804
MYRDNKIKNVYEMETVGCGGYIDNYIIKTMELSFQDRRKYFAYWSEEKKQSFSKLYEYVVLKR